VLPDVNDSLVISGAGFDYFLFKAQQKASTVDEKARPALSLLPLCARGRFLSKAQHEAGTTDEKDRPALSLLQL